MKVTLCRQKDYGRSKYRVEATVSKNFRDTLHHFYSINNQSQCSLFQPQYLTPYPKALNYFCHLLLATILVSLKPGTSQPHMQPPLCQRTPASLAPPHRLQRHSPRVLTFIKLLRICSLPLSNLHDLDTANPLSRIPH